MGIAASEDELHDAALFACESIVVGRAVTLARWIGTRRLPVTPRRVPVATGLHEVIQLLFGWAGDHLHVFRAGKKEYGSPFTCLERVQDEQAIRIQDAMVLGAGAWWEHEITLKRTLARDPGQNYPVCVAYERDSPVEYWSEDDPIECEPFDRAEINRKLTALASLGRQ